jgi:dipeptidyl aminopeptidase/acylaminoacyl peptidase
MKRLIVTMILAATLFAGTASVRGEKRAITFDDLIALGRIGSFEISPDGKNIAFTVTWFDKEANSSNTDIYLTPLKGGEPYRFVRSDGADYQPCWSPDGKKLAFVSTRGGSPQIWVIPVDGGEAKKITDIPTGVSSPLWSPDGKRFAFSSSVYPDCADMDCNEKKLNEHNDGKVKARLIDHLIFRHWNHWREGRWDHLFLIGMDGKEPVEINRGRTDVPPISLGGSRDYDFSPDGKEICYTLNPDPMIAISTNNDIWIVPVDGGEPKNITADNPANDNSPRYSPNGRYIAWRSMTRAGFEADRYRLTLYDRRSGTISTLTKELDYSIGNFDWAPDSRDIYFCTQDKGRYSIGRVSIKGGDARFVLTGGYDSNVRVSPDGKSLVFPRQRVNAPTDLYRSSTSGSNVTRLTGINSEILEGLEMNPLEEFWFEGAGGRQVHGMIVKPYGQAFTDAISGDWGGAPYEDIMKGDDYIVANFDFIDSGRIGAAGASYGGYMVDWIEGHTDRFECLVSHAGVYNLVSMYGATEELWFPEWEYKGTPWSNPGMYEKFSPHSYAADFATPCLVVHGEHDYRVPYTQGLEFFTALQRQGVESKLLFFPDEDHFVRKPLNAELWWDTLHEWFGEYLMK